ncbi:ParB/RepB/Spo0J family partition protein [Hyphococcus sp.]|uniref:ParB/RepB/Spo0J family partition protein n=1 Tax=Hyphococcus sp. TaxID=2038636 RepID=UPI003CCBD757
MDLVHIPLENLKVSALNMRAGRKKPPLDDILPSIRTRGVLVPLLVRPKDRDDAFEIIAGRRRYFASKEVAKESGEATPLPCRVLAAGDDAAAVEASILENVARLEPGDMQQFEAFKALSDKGRSVEEIANVFGVTELTVRRRLALGSLIPAIRKAYANEDIDGASVMALTLASEAKQKEWFQMFRADDMRAPRGRELKRWLLGGGDIETKVALFSLEDYDGDIYEDLFGEKSVFADAEKFWRWQDGAVEKLRESLIASGWAKVNILPRGEHFSSWEYDQKTKKQGGEVFVETRHSGEVKVHKGYAPRVRKAKNKGKDAAQAARPELSAPMQNYVDLHRHAALRAAMLGHPGAALRMLAAHLIAGAPNIRAEPDKLQTRKEATAESLAASKGEAVFAKERQEIAALIELEDAASISGGNGDEYRLANIFARLMKLSNEDVTRILVYISSELLAPGHAAIDCIERVIPFEIADWMTPDEAFFDLLRDRKVTNAMLKEIAGAEIAAANAGEPVKVQKAIIRDFLSGANGREAVPNWRPAWLIGGGLAYTDAGHSGAARAEWLSPLFAA